MKILSTLFLLIIILLGVTFATLNSEPVTLHYYLGERTLPLSLLLAGIFIAGCILGLLVTGCLLIKAKFQNHCLRKQLKLAEKEIENLRAIPLKD